MSGRNVSYALDMTHVCGEDRVVVAVDDLGRMLRARAALYDSASTAARELSALADSIDLAAIDYASA